jgi:hypothetical protein
MMLHAYETWTTSMNVLYVCAMFIYVFLLIYVLDVRKYNSNSNQTTEAIFLNAKNVTEAGK